MDCENLSNSLRNLNFDVSIYKDFKLNEMTHEIDGGRMDGWMDGKSFFTAFQFYSLALILFISRKD